MTIMTEKSFSSPEGAQDAGEQAIKMIMDVLPQERLAGLMKAAMTTLITEEQGVIMFNAITGFMQDTASGKQTHLGIVTVQFPNYGLHALTWNEAQVFVTVMRRVIKDQPPPQANAEALADFESFLQQMSANAFEAQYGPTMTTAMH
jgi:hypothetical protein